MYFSYEAPMFYSDPIITLIQYVEVIEAECLKKPGNFESINNYDEFLLNLETLLEHTSFDGICTLKIADYFEAGYLFSPASDVLRDRMNPLFGEGFFVSVYKGIILKCISSDMVVVATNNLRFAVYQGINIGRSYFSEGTSTNPEFGQKSYLASGMLSDAIINGGFKSFSDMDLLDGTQLSYRSWALYPEIMSDDVEENTLIPDTDFEDSSEYLTEDDDFDTDVRIILGSRNDDLSDVAQSNITQVKILQTESNVDFEGFVRKWSSNADFLSAFDSTLLMQHVAREAVQYCFPEGFENANTDDPAVNDLIDFLLKLFAETRLVIVDPKKLGAILAEVLVIGPVIAFGGKLGRFLIQRIRTWSIKNDNQPGIELTEKMGRLQTYFEQTPRSRLSEIVSSTKLSQVEVKALLKIGPFIFENGFWQFIEEVPD